MLIPLLEKSPLLAQLSEKAEAKRSLSVCYHMSRPVSKLYEHDDKKVNRQPVVLLTRLSQQELSSIRLPTSQISRHESSKTLRTSKKRIKLEQKDEKLDTTNLKAIKDVQSKYQASTKRQERTVRKVATPPAKNKGITLTSATQSPSVPWHWKEMCCLMTLTQPHRCARMQM